MILDTSVIIDMMNNNDEIIDNITIITLIDTPQLRIMKSLGGRYIL